jgi:D-beta-D-heptose 7-phosphate kinase/D-beta-D-heptose 1-phosphate adenosyltransferase
MFTRLQGILDQIVGKKILVIGDLMLDTYIFGTAERLSPEAPVPVVPVQKRLYCPGGAANVAENLLGLGAEVTLAGFAGIDAEGNRLVDGMMDSPRLVIRIDHATTSKIRVIANGQHVVRIDSEEWPDPGDILVLERTLEEAPRDFDRVILSDYCKGAVSEHIIRWAIGLYGKYVSVDSKRQDLSVFAGCGIITPNTREAERALGYPFATNEVAQYAGRDLLAQFNLNAVLLTRGKDGMILTSRDCPNVVVIPANARSVFDVTGAGDTVIAVLSAGLAGQASMLDASILAALAAGVVVGEVGTVAITREKLLEAIKDTRRREFRPYLVGVPS